DTPPRLACETCRRGLGRHNSTPPYSYQRQTDLSTARLRGHMGSERAPTVAGPRERLLDVSYDLFSHRGIRDVGVDEVIAKAGVAKATLYRHFPAKDDLVRAFLHEREQHWTLGMVETEALERGATPRERLLAIFDVFDE